ncbi:flagellar motor protein MotB [Halobacillus naozhouensis]|uniref:Flagellar motor protein MotB n=1 Tax=Halobacillus naozhouensis TaxID=554880 RepID=A0ABY8IXY2_9BACI|nr:flagellar motor protein MotB [Halobacillus naozhouensis]WFT75075.1 flagellar motor protein MotB [Halobacillus naozhouensis]
MRKKKQREENHTDESWLLPYADMLTLLLALFIVLFASSEIDAQKFREFSEVFRNEFSGGQGPMEHQESPIEPLSINSDEEEEKKEAKEKETEVKTQTEEAQLLPLKSLQKEIDGYIAKNKLTGDLTTSLSEKGLLVVILDNVFFDSGSAEVKSDGTEIARDMAEILNTKEPHEIVISGHTDNRPINNSDFQSNWELSVMRAVNFMSLLLNNEKLDPQLFSAKGYGQHSPVAPNDTQENRAKNRRVEVLILPNFAP